MRQIETNRNSVSFVSFRSLPGEALRLRSGWDYGMIVMLLAKVDLIWLWVRGWLLIKNPSKVKVDNEKVNW